MSASMGERPGFYLHFEVGMSWTPRHAPRSRQVTYMSKNMRDRASHFPRQLPPANTNFLAAPITYPYPTDQPQPQYPPRTRTQTQTQTQTQIPQPQSYYYHDQETVTSGNPSHLGPQGHHLSHHSTRQPHQQQQQSLTWQQHQPVPQFQQSDVQRSSRSQNRSSHERGSSAPPPFNDSPWDAEPEPMMASALPRGSRPNDSRPQIWKALPATPNQFRLGEDALPWTSWTFPLGHIEDGEDESDADQTSSRRQSEYAPESSRRRERDDCDRGRTREMQSLAAAMLTVDNGFEDQWWYQGPRLVTIAGDLLSPASYTQSPPRGSGVGWAIANEDREDVDNWQDSLADDTPRLSVAEMISPMSDFPSPISSYQGLRRSLTTRSDELHM